MVHCTNQSVFFNTVFLSRIYLYLLVLVRTFNARHHLIENAHLHIGFELLVIGIRLLKLIVVNE